MPRHTRRAGVCRLDDVRGGDRPGIGYLRAFEHGRDHEQRRAGTEPVAGSTGVRRGHVAYQIPCGRHRQVAGDQVDDVVRLPTGVRGGGPPAGVVESDALRDDGAIGGLLCRSVVGGQRGQRGGAAAQPQPVEDQARDEQDGESDSDHDSFSR
jgi:hypothetical protein